MHSRGGTNTAPAFAARMARLEDLVDPDRNLPPEERARRAHLALKAQMAALGLKASRSRPARSPHNRRLTAPST